ncbi:hypothetical protein [Paenibacillus herberti]|uniref:Uncharacterized protein n=1 Tax=Paenibacillus herberti TaxID=1619309 RepID=A0A229NW41_9BACL|nr:hypothetical protein [Paenibacillus herberti]OXM14081.1 hypothetical protein CGZ75_13920 [Paenibacillus herberti]
MIIPNFPSDLLEEHQRWHHVNHVTNNNPPPIGWGDRFLSFHRQYIRKVLSWYQSQGYDMRLVQPWTEVPQGIRMSPCYDRNAEMRLRFQPQSFATSDEMGRYLERLHACIHDVGSVLFNEPILQDLDLAPRSTYFYNIHGMIDNWYSNWERAMGGGMPPQQGFQSAPPGFPGMMSGMQQGMPGPGFMPGMQQGMPGPGFMPGMQQGMPGPGFMPGMQQGMPGPGFMPGMQQGMPGMPGMGGRTRGPKAGPVNKVKGFTPPTPESEVVYSSASRKSPPGAVRKAAPGTARKASGGKRRSAAAKPSFVASSRRRK